MLKKILIVVASTTLFSQWVLSSAYALECATPILDGSSDEVRAYYMPENKFSGLTITVPVELEEREVLKACRIKFEELSGAKVKIIPFPKQKDMLDAINLAIATNSGEFDVMTSGAGGAKEYGLGGHLLPLPEPPDRGPWPQRAPDHTGGARRHDPGRGPVGGSKSGPWKATRSPSGATATM